MGIRRTVRFPDYYPVVFLPGQVLHKVRWHFGETRVRDYGIAYVERAAAHFGLSFVVAEQRTYQVFLFCLTLADKFEWQDIFRRWQDYTADDVPSVPRGLVGLQGGGN